MIKHAIITALFANIPFQSSVNGHKFAHLSATERIYLTQKVTHGSRTIPSAGIRQKSNPPKKVILITPIVKRFDNGEIKVTYPYVCNSTGDVNNNAQSEHATAVVI